jgi:ketosteroid isomerase-like protein
MAQAAGFLFSAALMLGPAACAGGGRETGPDALLAADRAARPSLGTVLVEDAYYLAPNQPILEGRAAIRRAIADTAEGRVERTPLIAALSSDGSHGYTAGRAVGHAAAGGVAVHTKYLAYWRKDDGRWRLWAYVENPSPPAPDSVPPLAARAHASGGGAGSRGTTASDPLLAADAEFSARSAARGAGPAFGEFAEPAALLLLGAGRHMIWGDSAIAGFIGSAIPATDRLTWTPRAGHIAPGGDLGFTVGDAVYRHLPASGGEQLSYTKYLTVWRRQPDGRWRYAADAGNDQPAPAGGLRVEPAVGGVRLVNRDSGETFFTAFEQATTALVNWRPCVDLASCRFVAARSERVLPYDSIPGYGPAADSAVVFWWRRRARNGGWAFDSVRSVTIGLRPAGS